MTEAVRQAQPVVQPVAQQDVQRQSTEQTATASEVVDHSSESGAMPADEDERLEAPPAEASGEAEAGRESEEQSGDSAVEDSVDVEAEEQEPEPDEPPQDLTELPGVVVGDIDVRVRPGLAWGVIDRLESGVSVTVLDRAGGWYRVSYGAELVGWVRTTMLDLGEVEAEQVQEQSAPPLFAEWRGAEYGVIGQSADGAEVRLREMSEESPWIIGAPIDEVTMLADDVTLEDLPILIGDETVVFPGDDFRVGQGRILPKANEWMWLPWGWLLAHNDTHIWQWRPETDELEFVERPPGFARLSPDGRYLAIAELCTRDAACSQDNRVMIIPLDGSQGVTFAEEFKTLEVASSLGRTSSGWTANLKWSRDSEAVLLLVALFDQGREPNSLTTLLFHIEGHMTRFDAFWQGEFQGRDCRVDPPVIGGLMSVWEFHDDDTIAIEAFCSGINGDSEFHTLVFTFAGDFLRFEPSGYGLSWDEDVALLRSAERGDALGERPHVKWSPLRRHALVFEPSTGRTFLYRAQQHDLRAVLVQSGQSTTETQAWVPFDPHADHEWHSVVAYWLKEEQALLLATWYGYVRDIISGAVLLNLSTAQGVELDFGNKPWLTQWQAAADWSPTGDSFQIMLSGERVLPELLVDGLYSFRLLIVGRSGNVHREIITATSCRLPGHYADVPRHRAHWSPDGKLLAVGGRVLGGSFPCPE